MHVCRSACRAGLREFAEQHSSGFRDARIPGNSPLVEPARVDAALRADRNRDFGRRPPAARRSGIRPFLPYRFRAGP